MDASYTGGMGPKGGNEFRRSPTVDLFAAEQARREEKDRERAIALLRAAASSEPLCRKGRVT